MDIITKALKTALANTPLDLLPPPPAINTKPATQLSRKQANETQLYLDALREDLTNIDRRLSANLRMDGDYIIDTLEHVAEQLVWVAQRLRETSRVDDGFPDPFHDSPQEPLPPRL